MQTSTDGLTIRRIARIGLTGAILTGMYAGTALANGAKIWTVVKSSGPAQVQRDGGNWTALKPGQRVAPGNRIRTGLNGSVEMNQNGDLMTVSPKSQAQIAVRKTGSKTADVKQSFGTLLFKIIKRREGAEKFRVSTPYLAAVIKGTTFSVTVNATGAALHVAKGLVEVQSRLTRQVVMVRPGHTATVSSKRGTRMKLTGGKSKANKGAAIPGGNGVIKNAIGGGRIDVFKATNGLVKNHGPAAGQGRGNSKSGGTKVAAKGNSGNVKLPKSVKSALKSVAKSISAANANAGNGGSNGSSNGKGKGKGKNK